MPSLPICFWRAAIVKRLLTKLPPGRQLGAEDEPAVSGREDDNIVIDRGLNHRILRREVLDEEPPREGRESQGAAVGQHDGYMRANQCLLEVIS